MVSYKCKICKKKFNDFIYTSRKFCSFECFHVSRRTSKLRKCKVCKRIFIVRLCRLKEGRGRFCSKECYSQIRRTGSISASGYKIIRANGTKCFEHRVVMERMLGRKLHKFETVHHKNGRRMDNHPKNLELFANRHGPGQRVRDLRTYLKTIPKRLGGLK